MENKKDNEIVLASYHPYQLIEETNQCDSYESGFGFIYTVRKGNEEIFCSESESLSDKVFREVAAAYQDGISAILSEQVRNHSPIKFESVHSNMGQIHAPLSSHKRDLDLP